MIILWALVLLTEVVGQVLNNPTQARNDTNDTQVFNIGEQSLTAGQEFSITFGIIENRYISAGGLGRNILLAWESLCLLPYDQYIGNRDYTTATRPDVKLPVTEDPSTAGARALTTKWTLHALFFCYINDLKVPRAIAVTLPAVQCNFGLRDPGSSQIITRLGKVEFLPGIVQGSATSSSGSSVSVPDISGTERIKQRANAAAAANAGASSTNPDQDPISAALNATGEQATFPSANLTSRPVYSFQLRGNGEIISKFQLLISTLESLIDRASQPRSGPVYQRTYTSRSSDYIVQSQAAPGVQLSYRTVPTCFILFVEHVLANRLDVREGDWICQTNYQDVLVGRFTKKPDGNAGIAAPPTSGASDSVDVTRRNYQ